MSKLQTECNAGQIFVRRLKYRIGETVKNKNLRENRFQSALFQPNHFCTQSTCRFLKEFCHSHEKNNLALMIALDTRLFTQKTRCTRFDIRRTLRFTSLIPGFPTIQQAGNGQSRRYI